MNVDKIQPLAESAACGIEIGLCKAMPNFHDGGCRVLAKSDFVVNLIDSGELQLGMIEWE